MRFCANVSILFKEAPFVERFGRARDAGFSAVEFWWPSGEDLEDLQAAIEDAHLSVALFTGVTAGPMVIAQCCERGDGTQISHGDKLCKSQHTIDGAPEMLVEGGS